MVLQCTMVRFRCLSPLHKPDLLARLLPTLPQRVPPFTHNTVLSSCGAVTIRFAAPWHPCRRPDQQVIADGFACPLPLPAHHSQSRPDSTRHGWRQPLCHPVRCHPVQFLPDLTASLAHLHPSTPLHTPPHPTTPPPAPPGYSPATLWRLCQFGTKVTPSL